MRLLPLLALALALQCGRNAQAQILTYKQYAAPSWDYTLPADPSGSYHPTGFPEDPTFNKLLDDTGLRCELSADFVADEDGVIATEIRIDDGIIGLLGNGVYAPKQTWNTQFWSATFTGIPAGQHTVTLDIASLSRVSVLFYARFAALKCFEEALGTPQ